MFGTIVDSGVIQTRSNYAPNGTLHSAMDLVRGSGTLEITAFSALTIQRGSADSLTVRVDNGATLALGGTASSASGIALTGHDVLDLSYVSSTGMAATIAGFDGSDTIGVLGQAVTSAAYTAGISGAPGTLTLLDGGMPVETLRIAGDYTGESFVTTVINATETDVTVMSGITACFAEGTRIATPHGPRAVEGLRAGDLVLTAGGDTAPVVWLGHRRIACARHPRPHDVSPVRVRACLRALPAGARPAAFARPRGFRRRRADPGALPVERRIHRPGSRHANHLLACRTARARPAAGGGSGLRELSRHRQPLCLCQWRRLGDGACRFRARRLGGAVVRGPAPVRPAGGRGARRSAGSAASVGFRRHHRPGAARLGGRCDADAAMLRGVADLRHARNAATLRLCSRDAAPAELALDSDDTRRLGVALVGLRLDGEAVALDNTCLVAGWHAAEAKLRWTGGDALIRLDGASIVELALAPERLRYSVPAASASRAA